MLDNTYVTRKSRAAVIEAAAEHGVPVRCVWLTTSVEDAQVNAVTRLVERYGHLPDDRELALRKTDVAAFPPSVQFRYQRELEPPDPSEGFSRIEEVPFTRVANPAHVNRAVIAWCDDPAQLEALAPALRGHQDGGWTICVLSWQPGIEDGTRTDADVRTSFAAVGDRAGLRFDLDICPHGAGPPRCWCRKPLPGLGVALIHRHALDPAQLPVRRQRAAGRRVRAEARLSAGSHARRVTAGLERLDTLPQPAQSALPYGVGRNSALSWRGALRRPVEHLDGVGHVERRAIPGGQVVRWAWRRLVARQIRRRSRRRADHTPVRTDEAERAVREQPNVDQALVDRAVMAPAEQHQVVEARRAAVEPVLDVVGVAAA